MKYHVVKSDEFEKWLLNQTYKTQIQVIARLSNIESEGHFGVINYFDGIIELKWKSGLRIYTARYDHKTILVLYGGNKNGQNKDIQKAKKILKRVL